MSKEDGIWTAVLIVAGAALLAKIIEEGKKNDGKIYRCWRCKQILSKNEPVCPHCNAPQNWKGLP